MSTTETPSHEDVTEKNHFGKILLIIIIGGIVVVVLTYRQPLITTFTSFGTFVSDAAGDLFGTGSHSSDDNIIVLKDMKITTSKKVKHKTDDYISFVDGSNMDVSRGYIANLGPGDISVDQISKRPYVERYSLRTSGGSIYVNNINSNYTQISVEIGATGNIEVLNGSIREALIFNKGSGNITLPNLSGEVSLHVRASGSVEVQRVNGPLNISTSGTGNVDIISGYSDALSIHSKGSGNVKFLGTAGETNAFSYSSGNVLISCTKKEFNKYERGTGAVTDNCQ